MKMQFHASVLTFICQTLFEPGICRVVTVNFCYFLGQRGSQQFPDIRFRLKAVNIVAGDLVLGKILMIVLHTAAMQCEFLLVKCELTEEKVFFNQVNFPYILKVFNVFE